jgi:hypothetical protein
VRTGLLLPAAPGRAADQHQQQAVPATEVRRLPPLLNPPASTSAPLQAATRQAIDRANAEKLPGSPETLEA